MKKRKYFYAHGQKIEYSPASEMVEYTPVVRKKQGYVEQIIAQAEQYKRPNFFMRLKLLFRR